MEAVLAEVKRGRTRSFCVKWKGYELDVYDAHNEEIKHVAFVPN